LANYFGFYGGLSHIGLKYMNYFIRIFKRETIVSVPLATMTNLGVIVQDDDSFKTSRAPLWSAQDAARMPKLSHFLGAVTDPTLFPHYIFGTSLFNGELCLVGSFSRFSLKENDARLFMEQVVGLVADDVSQVKIF